jgi:HlyD family secretion protein
MVMRFWVKVLIFTISISGLGIASVKPLQDYLKKRNRPVFRTAKVDTGDIVSVVNSTGTVKPVLSVSVGAFVSGPITELNVDFNDPVKAGDIMARIDPALYDAAVARDEAALATRKAEVVRAQAQLDQAINNEERALGLRADNRNFISDTELDQFIFNRKSLAAQLEVAKAAIKQSEATLLNSKTNRKYTEIKAPVDGIVIDRKIDPGQTLTSQFQTPELFVVAPDLRKEMHVFASVDEADIGMIRSAKEEGQEVHFTVDAYPDDLFPGTIKQIRMSSTTLQNVVTYPVVITTENPDLKLLPGMTASISFTVGESQDIVRIPNAALRFYPQSKHVRKEDRKLLEGAAIEKDDDDDRYQKMAPSAKQQAETRRKRNRRHVWMLDGYLLKAIEVVTGISDNTHTELIEGEIKVGDKLVTGIKPKK